MDGGLANLEKRAETIRRIRAMAKDYPLRIFLMAETSKLAIAVGQRQFQHEGASNAARR